MKLTTAVVELPGAPELPKGELEEGVKVHLYSILFGMFDAFVVLVKLVWEVSKLKTELLPL